jgi:hypothetical protein
MADCRHLSGCHITIHPRCLNHIHLPCSQNSSVSRDESSSQLASSREWRITHVLLVMALTADALIQPHQCLDEIFPTRCGLIQDEKNILCPLSWKNASLPLMPLVNNLLPIYSFGWYLAVQSSFRLWGYLPQDRWFGSIKDHHSAVRTRQLCSLRSSRHRSIQRYL